MNKLIKSVNEVFAHGALNIFDCAKIICHYNKKDWKNFVYDFGIPVSIITLHRTNEFKLQLFNAEPNSIITFDNDRSITKLLTNHHAQFLDFNGIRTFEPNSVMFSNEGFLLRSIERSVYLKITEKNSFS